MVCLLLGMVAFVGASKSVVLTVDGESREVETFDGTVAEVLEQGEVADTPYNSMRIRINEGVSVRECITRANEAVELRSFKEVIPSMNDIFIRAVEGKF